MRNYIYWLFIGYGAIVISASCNAPEKKPARDFLAENLDTTIRPADNFFLYANGGWFKKNPIPASETSWGIGDAVQEDLYVRLRKINENAAASDAANGSISQKIKN